MVSSYAANLSTEKWIYKLLKTTLPGPFTYIMPSSSEVPKMVIDRKHHKLNKIKRKEIGAYIISYYRHTILVYIPPYIFPHFY